MTHDTQILGEYLALTRNIAVRVRPAFIEERSFPAEHDFFWTYTVIIENQSRIGVRLISRHWIITDAEGCEHAADGPGVVGETPLIRPGEAYHYTSGCPLATASGMMRGHYMMENDQGEQFSVQIPAFSLDSPYESRCLN